MLQYNWPSTPAGSDGRFPVDPRADPLTPDPGSNAMTCEEYLARHSEYLDEELGTEAAAEMRRHSAGCARCARYDRVLRRGLALVRDLEPVLPSRDSYLSLHEHLARTTPVPPAVAVPRVPLAASIAVAGVVALVAWSALFRATGVPASAAGESVSRVPVSDGRTEPLGTGAELMGMTPRVLPGVAGVAPLIPAGRPAWPRSPAGLVPVRMPMPGPYTPLLLRLPEYGQAPEPQIVPVSDPR